PLPTKEFVALWDAGTNSFADDPPNADFTCEVANETVNYVVELTDPVLDGGDLSYAVSRVPGGDASSAPLSVECSGSAHLFIDGLEAWLSGFAGDHCDCSTKACSYSCPEQTYSVFCCEYAGADFDGGEGTKTFDCDNPPADADPSPNNS
ncbi:MAG: hypothetical protein ABGY42_02970, partial [bacterium]